ncbi:hypothetical protein [Nonomuraea angiospora]
MEGLTRGRVLGADLVTEARAESSCTTDATGAVSGPAMLPTAPAAPVTNTVSPGRTDAT